MTVALACAAGVSSADAGAGTQMLLRAVVQKRAAITRMAHPPQVRITSEDVARGYVEVPTSVQLQVRSNSAEGYLLTFELEPAFARGAEVAGLAAPVEVGELPGSVRQPAFGNGNVTRTLELRLSFRLSQGAEPGSFDWPLRISAEPL